MPAFCNSCNVIAEDACKKCGRCLCSFHVRHYDCPDVKSVENFEWFQSFLAKNIMKVSEAEYHDFHFCVKDQHKTFYEKVLPEVQPILRKFKEVNGAYCDKCKSTLETFEPLLVAVVKKIKSSGIICSIIPWCLADIYVQCKNCGEYACRYHSERCRVCGIAYCSYSQYRYYEGYWDRRAPLCGCASRHRHWFKDSYALWGMY